MLKAQDIRLKTFGRGLRGYDVEEVKAFLSTVAQEWESQQEEQRRLKADLERAREQLEQYKETEQVLRMTLAQAEQNTRTILENAQREAAQRVQAAEAQAATLIQQGQAEKARIDAEVQKLIHQREELLGHMRAFLTAQLESTNQFAVNTYKPPDNKEQKNICTEDNPSMETRNQEQADAQNRKGEKVAQIPSVSKSFFDDLETL